MIDAIIIFAAKYLLFVMALAVAAYWFVVPRERRLRYALECMLALPLAYGLSRLAGLLFSHPQPFSAYDYEPLIPHEIDNSFPSDHSAAAGVLAAVSSLYHRGLGVLMWIAALGIGAARMFAGLHYPIDVVVGLMLGGLSAIAAYSAVHLYFSTR
jgi:undecaprenyl-diphosphatase